MLLVVINSIAFRMQLTTWILLPGIRDVNPRLCPVLPKTLGIFNHNSRAKVLVVTGKSTRIYGHNYPLCWATFALTCFDFS